MSTMFDNMVNAFNNLDDSVKTKMYLITGSLEELKSVKMTKEQELIVKYILIKQLDDFVKHSN